MTKWEAEDLHVEAENQRMSVYVEKLNKCVTPEEQRRINNENNRWIESNKSVFMKNLSKAGVSTIPGTRTPTSTGSTGTGRLLRGLALFFFSSVLFGNYSKRRRF